MIIDKKFLFIHIPKNAGMSVAKLFVQRDALPELASTYVGRCLVSAKLHEALVEGPNPTRIEKRRLRDKKRWGEWCQRFPPYLYGTVRQALKGIKKNYTSFSIIRHPYSRALSGWHYCHSTRNRPLLDVLKDPPIKSQDCGVSRGHPKPRNKGHDFKHFTLKQADFISYKGKIFVDHVLRLENLEVEFPRMCDELGIDTQGHTLPHVHRTLSPRKKVEDLTSREKRAIYKFYRRDFDLFGYKP